MSLHELHKLYASELEALTQLYGLRFSTPRDTVEKYLNEEQICIWKQKMRDARRQISCNSLHNPCTHLDFLLPAVAKSYPPSLPVPASKDPLYTAYKVLIKIAVIKKGKVFDQK